MYSAPDKYEQESYSILAPVIRFMLFFGKLSLLERGHGKIIFL